MELLLFTVVFLDSRRTFPLLSRNLGPALKQVPGPHVGLPRSVDPPLSTRDTSGVNGDLSTNVTLVSTS